MRSLTLKLTLAFLFVGLAGTILVAVIVGHLTRAEFDRFVLSNSQAQLVDVATSYYEINGSWDGVESALWRSMRGNQFGGGRGPQFIALMDSEGQTILGPRLGAGPPLPESGTEVPVEVDGETVGYLLFPTARAVGQGPGAPEAQFLAGFDRAIILSALAAGLLALLLGIALANTISRPVKELTSATRAVAAGELGRQVPVRTQDEIGELAESFNHMSADLARSNQVRRQMTADIAHDLRTPLSVILGYTEALADGKLPGNAPTYQAMYDQALHLSRLVDDLRTLSLADAGQLSLLRRPVAPGSLLDQTAQAHEAQAAHRDIALQVMYPADLPDVDVDPDRIVQVLGNLLSNALRYSPQGSTVRLAGEVRDGNVTLRVQDSGPGIPDEDLPHIFERFYRGDRARQDDGSSGLGLAIARSLSEAHGGRIEVESRSGQGTTFSVYLPLAKPAGEPA